jgi:hypothetical protein
MLETEAWESFPQAAFSQARFGGIWQPAIRGVRRRNAIRLPGNPRAVAINTSKSPREKKAILLEPSFDHKHQALAQRKHHRRRRLLQRSFEHQKRQPVDCRPGQILCVFAIFLAEQA